jgi:hypothetical protein
VNLQVRYMVQAQHRPLFVECMRRPLFHLSAVEGQPGIVDERLGRQVENARRPVELQVQDQTAC